MVLSNPKSRESQTLWVLRHRITALPAMVVADGSGKVLARQQGYSGKDRTAEFLKTVLQEWEPLQSSEGKP